MTEALRIDDRVLVEHWDVILDEATQEQSNMSKQYHNGSLLLMAPGAIRWLYVAALDS